MLTLQLRLMYSCGTEVSHCMTYHRSALAINQLDENHWGSGYKFQCPSGHRNTRQPLSYLFGGCSACKAIKTRKTNAEAATADPSASRVTPEISSQWHPYHYPEVAEEWSPDNPLSPWEIRPNTSQLAEPPLWVCKNDPVHVWRAMPAARVNGSQCPECIETGKSRIETECYSAALAHWGNAKSGSRIHSAKFQTHSSWTVDICVDLPSGKQLAIEYDGSYWHRDKADVDRVKSLDLLADGFLVV